MRAILVDADTKAVSEVETRGDLQEIYRLLKCHHIEEVFLGDHDVMYCDEDGLLVDKPGPFFRIGNHPHPISGRGIIFGVQPGDADHASTNIPLEQCRAMVSFPDIELVGLHPFSSKTQHPIFGECPVIGVRSEFRNRRPREKAAAGGAGPDVAAAGSAPPPPPGRPTPSLVGRVELTFRPAERLADFHLWACDLARTVIEEGHELMLWAIAIEHLVFVLETPWVDANHKARIAAGMRLVLREMHADSYAFMTGAYMTSIRDTDTDKLKRALSEGIADLPDSVEGLMVLTQAKGGEHYESGFRVDRLTLPPTIVDDLPDHLNVTNFDMAVGQMVNLFEPAKAVPTNAQEAREQARANKDGRGNTSEGE